MAERHTGPVLFFLCVELGTPAVLVLGIFVVRRWDKQRALPPDVRHRESLRPAERLRTLGRATPAQIWSPGEMPEWPDPGYVEPIDPEP